MISGQVLPNFAAITVVRSLVVFFRFASALILVVLISLVGIGLEKQTLETKRAISRQYFQKDLLLEMHARLRLRIQELTAPSHLAETSRAEPVVVVPQQPAESVAPQRSHRSAPVPRLPLLRWEHPVDNQP